MLNRKICLYTFLLFCNLTSLSFLPGIYRPLSLIICPLFFMFYLLSRIKENILYKDDIYPFLLVVFSVIISSIGYVFYGKFSLSEFLIFCLLPVVYLSCKEILRSIDDEELYRIGYRIAIILTILGIIELLSILGILPRAIKESIGILFSGRVAERLQLTTMESSWAAKILLFYIPFVYLYGTNKLIKVIYLMLILSTLSLSFVITFSFTLLIYYSYTAFLENKLKHLILSIFYVSSIVLIAMALLRYLAENLNTSDYFLNRITQIISSDNILDVIYVRDSLFIRILYPIIGIQSFIDNPFGHGFGNFYKEIIHYVKINGISLDFLPEVTSHIDSKKATPWNLYIRVLYDLGFIGFFIFIIPILMAFAKVKRYYKLGYNYKLPLLILSASIASGLQGASYIYMYLWVGIAFLNTRKV